jgi:hypothetical protein
MTEYNGKRSLRFSSLKDEITVTDDGVHEVSVTL